MRLQSSTDILQSTSDRDHKSASLFWSPLLVWPQIRRPVHNIGNDDVPPETTLIGIIDFQFIKRVDLSGVVAKIESQGLRVWIIILVPCGKENFTAIG